MTDKEALLAFRLREAEVTLADARTLLEAGGSTRTVINRSYYAMFYVCSPSLSRRGPRYERPSMPA
jgi:uncharacterized protein (UPF0332 family)